MSASIPTQREGDFREEFPEAVSDASGDPGHSPRESDKLRWWESRSVLGLSFSCLALLLPAISGTGLLIVIPLLVASIAAGIAIAPPAQRAARGNAILWVPLGFVVVCALVVVVGEISWLLGFNATATSLGAWSIWTIVLGSLAATSVLRRGFVRLGRDDLPMFGAGGLFLSIGVYLALTRTSEVLMRAVYNGTDFTRHVVILGQTMSPEGMSYQGRDVFLNYPRGLHALVGTLWFTSGGETFVDAWLAMEGCAWLMLSLMVMAMVGMAVRVSSFIQLRVWLGHVVAPVCIFIAFSLGMWVTTMLPIGFVTTILAGVCLSALAAAGTYPRWFGGAEAPVASAAVLIVTCHSWPPIAPAAAILLVVGLVAWFRKGRPALGRTLGMAGVVLVALLASMPPVLARLAPANSASDLVDVQGGSGLSWPGFVWWCLTVSAVAVVAAVWRRRTSEWAYVWVSLAGTMAVVVLALMLLGESPWNKPSYYTLKSLWTASVLVLPVGILGLLWLVQRVTLLVGAIPRRFARLAVAVSLVGVTVTALAGVAGQTAGTMQSWRVVTGNSGRLPVPAIAATQLEQLGITRGSNALPPIMIWGLDPWVAQMEVVTGQYRVYDRSAMEATKWFDNGSIFEIPTEGLGTVEDGCEFLRKHPDAIRVAGPSPETGAAWLMGSGCPLAVVQPEKWVRARIPADLWVPLEFKGELPTPLSYEEANRIYQDLAKQYGKPSNPGTSSTLPLTSTL